MEREKEREHKRTNIHQSNLRIPLEHYSNGNEGNNFVVGNVYFSGIEIPPQLLKGPLYIRHREFKKTRAT